MINNKKSFSDNGTSKTGGNGANRDWDNCNHEWEPIGIIATMANFPQGEVASSIFCKKCGYIVIRKQ